MSTSRFKISFDVPLKYKNNAFYNTRFNGSVHGAVFNRTHTHECAFEVRSPPMECMHCDTHHDITHTNYTYLDIGTAKIVACKTPPLYESHCFDVHELLSS